MMQAQLEEIIPRTAISRHLAELAHLYETTCPVIANLYALIAPLSPESLPQSASGTRPTVDGDLPTCHAPFTVCINRVIHPQLSAAQHTTCCSTLNWPIHSMVYQMAPLACAFKSCGMTAESGLDFISSNAEAHRALMHLHPCKLMRLEQGERVMPGQAADLVETASQSASAAPSTTSDSLMSAAPESAASQQKQKWKAEHGRLRQPAADPSTYQHIRQEQVSFDFFSRTWHMPTSQQLPCDGSRLVE